MAGEPLGSPKHTEQYEIDENRTCHLGRDHASVILDDYCGERAALWSL